MEVLFDKEKETKNTVRFQEREGEQPPVIGILYIKKWAVKSLGDPNVVKLSIEKGE